MIGYAALAGLFKIVPADLVIGKLDRHRTGLPGRWTSRGCLCVRISILTVRA